MRMHYLQHAEQEGPGAILDWSEAMGYPVTRTRLYAGDPLPAPHEFDWLVVMGGAMNIYEEDEHPWLKSEKDLIRAAIDGHKRVLGVCLGSQLIADVLGGPVTRNPHVEIGWFPVTLTDQAADGPILNTLPKTFPAMHWHGDTFAIPQGAVHVAASEGCAHQAFEYRNHVVGLQFHIEMTADQIDLLLRDFAHEMVESPYVQEVDAVRAGYSQIPEMQGVLNTLLDAMADV
jgi:GMP synthase-like glutamine amidotransferase